MGTPNEKQQTNSYIIYVAQNQEGQWWANLDATDGQPELNPNGQPQGHGMTLREATLDLLDQWKTDIISQRENPVVRKRD